MTKKVKLDQLVMVEWYDAQYNSGWFGRASVPHGLLLVTTVGYVAKENKVYITLARSVSKHGYEGVITIPRNWVTKIVEQTSDGRKKAKKG